MSTSTTSGTTSGQAPLDDHYDEFLAAVRTRFAACTTVEKKKQKKKKPQAKSSALFTTATPELSNLWLAALPEALRRENACSTCKAFLRNFGGLVTIDDKGRTTSVLWNPDVVPEPYRVGVRALAEAVSGAPITGVFVSADRVWGTPDKGGFWHLAITPPDALVHTNAYRNPSQLAAEKREDFRTLTSGLEAFPLALVERAAALLQTGGLHRSEKCIEVANWLLEVHRSRKSARSERARDNLTWAAVATAPPGYCHVRSTMIATLLTDLANNLPFDQIKARFDEKMHPLQYQRPTAAPRGQNIERAEKLIEQLRSAGALERRFAKLEDIQALWRPIQHENARRKDGVFAHVRARARSSTPATDTDVPAAIMTWAKFSATVLPEAAAIHYRVPDVKAPLLALVTAKHDDAPPIIQWDHANARNPFTWYFYSGGSLPARWNLQPNTDPPVSAIALAPHMWAGADQHAHHGKMVLFLLDGAKDLDYRCGSAFFPEFLKQEYREARATLEAFARTCVVVGASEATACGIGLHASGMWAQRFRVTDKHGVSITYQLDRWD
jgi:hypothetical protein